MEHDKAITCKRCGRVFYDKTVLYGKSVLTCEVCEDCEEALNRMLRQKIMRKAAISAVERITSMSGEEMDRLEQVEAGPPFPAAPQVWRLRSCAVGALALLFLPVAYALAGLRGLWEIVVEAWDMARWWAGENKHG